MHPVLFGGVLVFDYTQLGPPDPAPHVPGQGKSRVHSVQQIIGLLAAWVLTRCLRQQAFSAQAVWQAIPELRDKHRVPNAVAATLGAGIHGQGLQLWRGPDGAFAPCKQNAALAARRLSEAQLRAVAQELGLPDLEALARAILALPSIRPAPPGSVAPRTAAPDQPPPTLSAADTAAPQPA
jgi:hypothetical protein